MLFSGFLANIPVLTSPLIPKRTPRCQKIERIALRGQRRDVLHALEHSLQWIPEMSPKSPKTVSILTSPIPQAMHSQKIVYQASRTTTGSRDTPKSASTTKSSDASALDKKELKKREAGPETWSVKSLF